jgi:hypothetical protein
MEMFTGKIGKQKNKISRMIVATRYQPRNRSPGNHGKKKRGSRSCRAL